MPGVITAVADVWGFLDMAAVFPLKTGTDIIVSVAKTA